ncbi:MAG TPA: (Fe-S)-binding protein [Chloroflexota bacterium]
MASIQDGKTMSTLAQMVEKCNRCGFCQAGCPTYKVSGLEWQVSRGRVALVRDILDGRIDLRDDDIGEALGTCLRCGGCTVHCPPQVDTARVVDLAVEELTRQRGESWVKRVIFRNLLPSKGLLSTAGKAVWLAQATGAQPLARSIGLTKVMGSDAHRAQDRLPKLAPRNAREMIPSALRPVAERKYRVAYFVGCATNLVFPEIATAAVRVLQANAVEVLVPEAVCCGKPPTAYGDVEAARALARANIDAFADLDVDAIVSDCATCGSFITEYPKLMAEDARYAEKAKTVAGKFQDLGKFLAGIPLNDRMGEVKARITYHDPCHAVRFQGVSAQPRKLLKSIPGVDFKEAAEADMCCGGAGSFFLTHYDLSQKVLARKMGNVEKTGAEYLATGCPGCMMQLSSGARNEGMPVQVVHTVQLLDRAYGSAR